MKPLLILALLTLAACGADGPPTTPGATVSGDAQFGIVTTLK
jgi:predicted small lipoprotein YifL